MTRAFHDVSRVELSTTTYSPRIADPPMGTTWATMARIIGARTPADFWVTLASASSMPSAPSFRVVAMNTSAGIDGYERRVAPDGRTYYWPNGNGMEFFHTAEATDVEALSQRAVTVTPLWYDLTEHGTLESWRARLG